MRDLRQEGWNQKQESSSDIMIVGDRATQTVGRRSPGKNYEEELHMYLHGGVT